MNEPAQQLDAVDIADVGMNAPNSERRRLNLLLFLLLCAVCAGVMKFRGGPKSADGAQQNDLASPANCVATPTQSDLALPDLKQASERLRWLIGPIAPSEVKSNPFETPDAQEIHR